MKFYAFLTIIFASIRFNKSQSGCIGEGNIWPELSPCRRHSDKVSCEGLDSIEPLMVLPRNLVKLTIKLSTFKNLNVSLFKNCSSLKQLELYNNDFTISEELFKDLNDSLKKLFIENNPRMNLSQNIFHSLKYSLRKLRIYNTHADSQEIFESLTRLTHIELDGIVTKRKLGKSFSKLKSLKVLKLKNFDSDLTNDTFQYVKNCTKLILNWANISSIHPDTFAVLKYLKHLDLSYNMKMNLSDVIPSLHNVSKDISTLILKYLIGSGNPTASVDDEFFEILKTKTNLRKLMLNKNEIIHLSCKIKNTLRSLKVFDISYNRLSNVFYLIMEIFVMTNLETLNISFQTKRFTTRYEFDDDDDDDEFKNKNLLDDLNSKDSKISEYESDYVSKMDDDDAIWKQCKSRNNITCTFPKNLKVGDMDSRNWCIPCPKKLKKLMMNSAINVYSKYLPLMLILGDCSIEEIQLRHNGFINCGGQIMIDRPNPTIPVFIDLSFNFMECISPDLFEFSLRRNLVIGRLNLESNSLSNQLAGDDKSKTFHRYVDLTELNLSDNKIKKLPKAIFKNLRQLERLNLSKNSLQVIEFDITDLTRLRFLDLSENLFISIGGDQQAMFSMISLTNGYFNFTLAMHSNPMQCSCETMAFINWIISNATKIFQFEKLNCLYYNKLVCLNDIETIATQLMLFCYAALPLKILGILLGLAMLCFLIGFIVYKYQMDVRYYMLKRAQTRRETNLSTKSKSTSYVYDAFVCYDKSDTSWVLQELLLNLENPEINMKIFEVSNQEPDSPEPPLLPHQPINAEGLEGHDDSIINDLRLCIHERDFEPGEEIETNILMAIENSRRVILVISKNFLKSRWCTLELEMAKMESLVRGVNLIVAVFLEPLEDTTKSLDWLTKYYTYLEWFRYDDYRRHEFWRRLRVSLGARGKRRQLNQLD